MKTKLFTPPVVNEHGLMTVSAEDLAKAYEILFHSESSPDNVEILGNWLSRYDGGDFEKQLSLSRDNWYGKVTLALLGALKLGAKKPKNKTELISLLKPNLEYATFNRGPHLAVDIPAGHATITARTSDGKRITFAFVPYDDNTTGCVDIEYHDAPAPLVENGHTKLNQFHAIGFTPGTTTFDTRGLKKPTTLIAVLLADRHYKK